MTDAAADAAAQLNTHRADYMAGKLSQGEFSAHQDRLGPLTVGAAPSSTAGAEAAVVKDSLTELRQRRLEGKVSDADFFAAIDKLGPQLQHESGEVTFNNGDGTRITVSAQEAAALEEAYSVPQSPMDYQVPWLGDSDEAQAFHRSALEAMHTAGVPKDIGSCGGDVIERLSAQFQNADVATIRSHMESVDADLRARWGDQYQTRYDRIEKFISSIDGPLGDLLANRPYLAHESLFYQKLDSMLEHRARKRV